LKSKAEQGGIREQPDEIVRDTGAETIARRCGTEQESTNPAGAIQGDGKNRGRGERRSQINLGNSPG